MTAEPEPEIAEFGDEDDGVVERRRSFVTAFVADPRLVPLLAILAGVAAFGSLLGEWFSVLEPGAPSAYRMGINGAGMFAVVYLLGVLLLAALLLLVIDGPVAARRAARLAGYGIAGVMLAVLIAFRFGANQLAVGYYPVPEGGPTITFGRGLTAAFAAVILAGAALVLAGRVLGRLPATATATASDPVAVDVPRQPVDWAWRRPRRSPSERPGEPDPIDLTVQPATPFAHPDPSTER